MYLETIYLRVCDPCQIPYIIFMIRLLTRLRLGLSHLNEHRFNYNFDNCINPLCTCTLETESTTRFFLHCYFYSNIRKTLLVDLHVININIKNFSETVSADLLLYGKSSFDKIQNKKILTTSIKYIVILKDLLVPFPSIGNYFINFVFTFYFFTWQLLVMFSGILVWFSNDFPSSKSLGTYFITIINWIMISSYQVIFCLKLNVFFVVLTFLINIVRFRICVGLYCQFFLFRLLQALF